MDTYRGNLVDNATHDVDPSSYAYQDEDSAHDAPPPSIGTDERRMQVRAYNHWASLLGNRNFPSIEDLEPDNLPDFGPYSVLLDFTGGIENPGIHYLGAQLATECGTDGPISSLSDVPPRSLLSRITDHYMQILANQAPIGFEAEFVNQRGQTILYRGILLPFSSDDDGIDFIYGVINWKEMADQATTAALLREVEQALDETPVAAHRDDELTDWADAPADIPAISADAPALSSDQEDDVLDLAGMEDTWGDAASPDSYGLGEDEIDDEDGEDEDSSPYGSLLAKGIVPDRAPRIDPLSDIADFTPPVYDLAGFEAETLAPVPFEGELVPAGHVIALPELSEDDMGLGDWLASARELAEAAHGCEDRTRQALYAAIGRAWDFALAALREPQEFAEILADYGLTMQDRAPMTPVVKLVFGADYDKTRLTEYAAALTHAQRMGLSRGELGEYLARAPGGLKGVVAAERKLRREESGRIVDPRDTPREALARKLRRLEPRTIADLPATGAEFTLLVARRMADGSIAVVGEVADDVPLLERAARKLLG